MKLRKKKLVISELTKIEKKFMDSALFKRSGQIDRQTLIRKLIREIGDTPLCANVDRRIACSQDLKLHLLTYHPEHYPLPFSEDHLMVIQRIQDAVLKGGLFAMAMPRGSGKTTMCEDAALWALLHAHRKFVVIIGATEKHAIELAESIKSEVEVNELLLADFPETVRPIQQLEGIINRAAGQLCEGERTHITWANNELVLPTTRPSAWRTDPKHRAFLDQNTGTALASGGIVRLTGITGRIRGMKFKRSDGTATRPDFVILDDPQTDDSAKSNTQSAYREGLLAGAILGLSGPGKKIAGVMPCTVIRHGDMADRILNPILYPQWNGVRTKMVYNWPTNQALWEEYASLRAISMRKTGEIKEATDFYDKNRLEMDAGAHVAWPERYKSDEISGIQHAWNLRLQGEASFFSEYQNEPLVDTETTEDNLSAELVCGRLSSLERGLLHERATLITAFVDVQQRALYWMICAWSETCDGWILDYGTTPEQHRAYFQLRDVTNTLADMGPGGLEAQIYRGLDHTANRIVGRKFANVKGAELNLDAMLIDGNWSQSTDTVYDFCRQSAHAAVLRPSHGRYVGASTKPMSEWQKEPGERAGTGWKVGASKRGMRSVVFDANMWKSWIAERFLTTPGDKGSLQLFGKIPEAHRLLADHLSAEYRVRTTGRGRTVDEWKPKPGVDNHWFDCLVGCAVAASMTGMKDSPEAVKAGTKVTAPARVRFSDMQKQSRLAR